MRTYFRRRKKTGLIAALAVLAVLVITAVSLRITDVTVSGTTRYTPEQIEQTYSLLLFSVQVPAS